jgi:hypothetical protein
VPGQPAVFSFLSGSGPLIRDGPVRTRIKLGRAGLGSGPNNGFDVGLIGLVLIAHLYLLVCYHFHVPIIHIGIWTNADAVTLCTNFSQPTSDFELGCDPTVVIRFLLLEYSCYKVQ